MKYPFDQVFEDCTRFGTKITTDEYLPEGKYPIIDQGQNDIVGFRNESDGLFTKVPAVIFGDHTRIVKYVEEPCFLGADGVKLLCPVRNDTNCKFLYYQLKNANIPDTGYNRHFKWVKELIFSVPSVEEQISTVTILDKTNELITLRKLQLSKLDELVKSKFIEMFGDPVTNSKGWNIHQFDKIASSRLGKMLDGKKQTGEYQYPYLANSNVQWFKLNLDNLNKMDFDEKDQKEFAMSKGDLLVCEGGEIGRCAIWNCEIEKCFFQKALHRVRCDTKVILPEYLARVFYYRYQHNGFEDVVGSKSTIAHLTGEKLKRLPIVVPPIDLQNQFADFAQQVDKSKSEIQKSLEKLETLKKALMQQYFG